VPHHHPPEVLRTEAQLLQPVLQADLGRCRRQVDEVLPHRQPLVLGPGGDARLPQDPALGVLDDVGDGGALVRRGLPLRLLDEERQIEPHVTEVDALQADAHVPSYRNAGMMCSAKSSIWRRASSIGIRPWSKNHENHSSSPSPSWMDATSSICRLIWSTV